MRNIAGVWLTVIVAVGGLLSVGSPAIAAQAATQKAVGVMTVPAGVGDWWRLVSFTSVYNKADSEYMQVRGTPATGDLVFAYQGIDPDDWYQWNVPE
jgi:hypothetical protein